MNDEDTIRLGIGLGGLHFGATRDQAEAYLGKPEKVSTDDLAGMTTICWYYRSRGLSVHFDEEDSFRLGTIETSSPSASLNGRNLIGKTKREVLEFMAGLSSSQPKEEVSGLENDGDSRSCLLSFTSQDLNLNLWFEDDVLTEIQWGNLSDENGDSIWPKKQQTTVDAPSVEDNPER